MRHFFIAYSRRDFYFAESLFYALQSKGINAWMDVWKITPGDNWDNAITNAIQSSQGLILIATKESLKSPYVRDEICRAYLDKEKPIYLVIRGQFSMQDLLISHTYLEENITIDLYKYVRVIIDMRAGFMKGSEKIAAAVAINAVYRDKLPSVFNFKMEKILYIPPIIIFLALVMTVTHIWKYGIGILYLDQMSQLMGYIRDIVHGDISEVLLLVPAIIESIISIGSLVNIIVFGFNFYRRKHIRGVNHFALLLTSVVITGLITLITGFMAVALEAIYLLNPVGDFLERGESAPSLDKTLALLLVVHAITFILIVILVIVFIIMFFARDGRGAILRWLPTGYASEKTRRKGNENWIKKLPSIKVSSSPFYKSYFIVVSSEDISTAQEIRSMLQERGYRVTDNRIEAECDLIILSPFADDSPLKNKYKVNNPKPIIYVLARSMQPQKDTSIAIQWIDYRRPTKKQFWKQWERDFAGLQGNDPVFPYIPESLGDSLLPMRYGCGIRFMMIAVMVGSALLISGMNYVVFLRKTTNSLLLPTSVALLLVTIGTSYYMIAQMIRGVISLARVKQWSIIAGLLTIVAALMVQSPLLFVGGLSVVLVNKFRANRLRLRTWLPPQSKQFNRNSLLQPISNYKTFTSYEYSSIMIAGFLALNALFTNLWVIPKIPLQYASKPYTVSVPGPYYLAEPGLWSQDTYADAFGYHFDYHPDKLEVSQDQATGYPTWLKFSGVNSYPMRFAPHFRSSIHVHFANNDVRTELGFVLNNFVKLDPSDLIGPQLRLSASGLWTIIESNGKHYSDRIIPISKDYTLEIEVNGILCVYKINGKEITAIADTSLSSINDILLSLASYVPGGTTFYLSNFTYIPLSGPVLSQTEAINHVAKLDTMPYTTVAPGWNCISNDGRWNARYEPARQNTTLACTTAGTRLNTTEKDGVLLNFDNSRFGGLPTAFDYSFEATFEGVNVVQCIAILTYKNITTLFIAYAYAFVVCSDGTWATRYLGYHTENMGVFLNERLKFGHITVKRTVTIFVEFRLTVQNLYVNNQLITSYGASDLMPTILFGNGQGMGAILYSNFSFVPRTQ